MQVSRLTLYYLFVAVSDEVAVIDEIQMMRDKQRGWAWTRALLGECLTTSTVSVVSVWPGRCFMIPSTFIEYFFHTKKFQYSFSFDKYRILVTLKNDKI